MIRILSTLLLSLFGATTLLAQIPRAITFQGYVADAAGNPIANGNHVFDFSIYDQAVGGIPLFQETQTLAVLGGSFDAMIGSVTAGGIPEAVAFDRPYFLGITVDGGQELSPRTPMTSVPYALRAGMADAVAPNATGVGLTLPYERTMSSDPVLFKLTNSGNGAAGEFNGASSMHTALQLSGGLIQSGGSIISTGDTGGVNVSGAGVRFLWSPTLRALRAGVVSGDLWDSVNIGVSSVAMGSNTKASGERSTALGANTTASGQASTALGTQAVASGIASMAMGRYSLASGTVATAMGGYTRAEGDTSTAMGCFTTASGHASTAIGYRTTASGLASTALGANTTASGERSTALGTQCVASGQAATAMGRYTLSSRFASTSMGAYTQAIGDSSTAMGSHTIASGATSTAMGYYTTASGFGSTAMGFYTTSSERASTAMGYRTTASGDVSTAMGWYTTASGVTSTAMGNNTTASGDFSTAMGIFASTNGKSGSFVYGDNSTSAPVNNTFNNQFMVRASGGTIFYSNSGLTAGVSLAQGGGSWSSVSNRDRKENFRTEDGESILAKLSSMQVPSWNYKSQPKEIRHIGPMAQDFYAAFGLGESDTTITGVDIDGINMIAIQALEKRTSELREVQIELQKRTAELEGLKQEVKVLRSGMEEIEELRIRLLRLENAGEIRQVGAQ